MRKLITIITLLSVCFISYGHFNQESKSIELKPANEKLKDSELINNNLIVENQSNEKELISNNFNKSQENIIEEKQSEVKEYRQEIGYLVEGSIEHFNEKHSLNENPPDPNDYTFTGFKSDMFLSDIFENVLYDKKMPISILDVFGNNYYFNADNCKKTMYLKESEDKDYHLKKHLSLTYHCSSKDYVMFINIIREFKEDIFSFEYSGHGFLVDEVMLLNGNGIDKNAFNNFQYMNETSGYIYKIR